jgi:anti-anti-sigma factor
MKRHQMAIAASVGAYDDGPMEAVAAQAQTTSYEKTRHTTPAAGEARLQPAGVDVREHTLILTGELDRRSAHALEAEIERLCEEGVSNITLDLRELRYIDPIGVAVIAFRCRLCQRRGYEFALIPGGRMIHRAFEQAGVAGLLPFQAGDCAPRGIEEEQGEQGEQEEVAAPPTLAPALVLSHPAHGAYA